jgi:hypothetical protein
MMAKRQTRKSISFNRGSFEVIKRVAEQQGKSMSQFVEDTLRAAGIALPETAHTKIADAKRAAQRRPQLPGAESHQPLDGAAVQDYFESDRQNREEKAHAEQSEEPKKQPRQRLDPGAAAQRSAYLASIRAQERADARAAKLREKSKPKAQPTQPPSKVPPSIDPPRREGPIRRALGDAVADWAKEP